MIPTLRQQRIMDLLREREVILLPDLVAAMDISESTIRRDLKALAKSRQIELLRGGGVRLHQENIELHIDAKLVLHKEAKAQIARAAASLIYPGDIVFLDPSSANYMLVDFIQAEHVTVVTNSILFINKLLKTKLDCLLIGGQIKPSTGSCIGSIAEGAMRGLRFSKAFLGANGMSVSMGLTNHDPSERAIKRIAIDNAAGAYFLVDSSKLDKVAMCNVAAFDECTIITEKPLEALQGHANVLIASDAFSDESFSEKT